MLSTVEVRNRQGDLLTLVLQEVSNGFALEDIDGLDPVKAVLVSSSFAQMDGVQYHSSRREARNLTMKIGFEPNHALTTVRALRNHLYKYLMPKSNIELRLYDTDGLVVNISGMVESNDAPLFVEEPDASISIMCFNPDFIDMESVELNGMTTSGSTETLLSYTGSVETGIELILYVDRDLTEFTIYHSPPDGTIRSLDFAAVLEADDVLTISTIPGSKGAILTRGGVNSSVLYGVSPQANWIELLPGDNNIRVYAEGDAIPYDLKYVNRYGGL